MDSSARAAGKITAASLLLNLRFKCGALGLRTVIFTDISRDGLGSGLNIASTRELAEVSGLDVIASGGVHTTGGCHCGAMLIAEFIMGVHYMDVALYEGNDRWLSSEAAYRNHHKQSILVTCWFRYGATNSRLLDQQSIGLEFYVSKTDYSLS